jgi:hypothetical protein
VSKVLATLRGSMPLPSLGRRLVRGWSAGPNPAGSISAVAPSPNANSQGCPVVPAWCDRLRKINCGSYLGHLCPLSSTSRYFDSALVIHAMRVLRAPVVRDVLSTNA